LLLYSLVVYGNSFLSLVSTLISNCEYFRIVKMETLQGNLSLCSLRSCSLLSFSPSSDVLFPASFKDALCPIELLCDNSWEEVVQDMACKAFISSRVD
jgi:hypothetical protein